MRLSVSNLKEIIKHYKPNIINKRINDMVLVNSRLFLFYLKNNKEQLLIDLDNNNPHIGMLDAKYDELTLPSEFIAKALMKGRPLINDIEVVNNDKIIKITTSSTDSYYHHNKYYLYIELIVSHANMILTDSNNKVIVAFYETNLNNPRLIVKNNKYTYPSKKNEDYDSNDFNIDKYIEMVNASYLDSLNKRKKELYGPLIKKQEKKIKSLEKKISKINESYINAKEKLGDINIGNYLLMHINEIKKGDDHFENIKLDIKKSPIENANMYFDKYKKSKRTISTTQVILKDINKELETAKYYLDVFKYGEDKDIKLLINNKENKKEINTPAYYPYYIKYKNINYYYGHNALENDYLSFSMFKKNSKVIWMHIKDHKGAHLIINKENTTNEELDIASSLLLIINKLNTGEIMYTSRANITRGDKLGLVNILNYKSITMHKINPIVYDLIKREKRVHE